MTTWVEGVMNSFFSKHAYRTEVLERIAACSDPSMREHAMDAMIALQVYRGQALLCVFAYVCVACLPQR